MEDLCEDLAGEGFVAINISYHFAPQNLFPKALEDVRDAVSWIKQNASFYNIDPTRIAVWGYSAKKDS